MPFKCDLQRYTGGAMGGAGQRPILCLFDRNFDLSTALQHVWTYQPLVHDVLGRDNLTSLTHFYMRLNFELFLLFIFSHYHWTTEATASIRVNLN